MRDEATLAIEQERRELSAEERRAVTAANLVEKAARGTWVRSLVSPTTVVPILTAIGGIIATLAALLPGTWIRAYPVKTAARLPSDN